nr:3-dehydro-L-gulonate 2-dehydrogenase [Sedimentibacter sp.]
MIIPFEVAKIKIKQAMIAAGLSEEQAEICSQIHTESSRDGVYSHGINRVSRFINYINRGWININGSPSLIKKIGCIENYDGNMGIGIVNAKFSMKRAVELAKEYGIGVVSLKNTTHWMRGGTYAWDAVNYKFIGICWTNTQSYMPAWGSKEPCVGNNPICIGIPYKNKSVVLDIALSQYSDGKLQIMHKDGRKLPYYGGFDINGNLTDNPESIIQSKRMLPIGYWKGSGLAIILDMLAAILANGLPSCEIDKSGKGSCGACCQIFIAINPYLMATTGEVESILEKIITHLHGAETESDRCAVKYPGEHTAEVRDENTLKGIFIDDDIWEEICSLKNNDF